jgi:hypothetical protein
MKHVPSITEKPPKEKKHRKPKVSKKKSSDDEDDKPQRKPVEKRPKKAAFSDSDVSEEEFMPLFLYFNLCPSIMLDSLSCSSTSISNLLLQFVSKCNVGYVHLHPYHFLQNG